MVGPEPVSRLARAAQPPLGQVVLEPGPARRYRDEAVLGPDGGQHGQVTLDLAPDPAERDAEHALTALQRSTTSSVEVHS